MGLAEANVLEGALLFWLSPIIIQTLIGLYAARRWREQAQRTINRLLPAPTDNDSNDPDQDSGHFTQSISSHHRLYKHTLLGDADGFKRTLADLAADGDDARVEILSHLSPQKNTLLHIAAACEDETLPGAILELHPLLMFKQNNEGDSPLHIAAKGGMWRLEFALLSVEMNVRKASGQAERELATDTAENGYPFLQNMQNNQGNTALHEALINGHPLAAKTLIEENRIVTIFFELVNKENKSPLYLAVEAGYVELVKIMKEKAEDLDGRACRGKSPMHAAILSRNREILEMLSSMRLNIVNPKDEKGKSPLHYAASTGYLEGARFLLGRSTTDAYQPDKSGIFPIHTAASKGYVYIIAEFLQCCPDSWELLNKRGQNILHIAAKCGRDNAVKYVLERMPRKLINQKDNNGDTPLHLATKYRHPMVVHTLTWDKRTSLKLVNNEGFTVRDIAEGNMDSIASFHGRLTWIALKSAGAPRAQHLHVLLREKEQVPSQMSLPDFQFPNLDLPLSFQLPANYDSKLCIFDSFKGRVNTLLVVTTLVATVTFAAGFTMPGGYNSSDPDQGMATMLSEPSFQAFVICNTIAMYCSIIVAVTLIWAQLGDLNLIASALRLALPLLGIALTMMSLAFTAGVYVVVGNLHWLGHVVLSMGGIFMAIILLLFIPLFFPSQSTNLIMRYITYFPFRLAVLVSGACSEVPNE